VRTWNRIRHMTMTAALLWLCVVTVTGQQPQAPYFKEDHLTGADYICLAAEHSYHLTGGSIWAFGPWNPVAGNIQVMRSSSFRRMEERGPTPARESATRATRFLRSARTALRV
jgi:hypothetical protein